MRMLLMKLCHLCEHTHINIRYVWCASEAITFYNHTTIFGGQHACIHIDLYLIFVFLLRTGFIMGGIGGFGVTGGAHRLWSHRSYKAKTPLRIILMMCFSSSGQNTLYDWVRDHRVHHKFSETDADPHNSNRGFFFAHVGWLMMHKHPDVIRKGNMLDMSDILDDPVVQFHQK